MVDFTYGMTLASDLTGSQWMGWWSGFLCGLWSHCCSVCHFGWYQDVNGHMMCVVFWMDSSMHTELDIWKVMSSWMELDIWKGMD